MSSPENGPATTVVIEMAPGWIYVKIAEPKPEPARIELLLALTIEQWFKAHPECVIDRTESLTEHGILNGINVWYHVENRQPVPANAEPPQQVSSIAIEVHDQIRQQLPMEHIEAVVDEAIQTWRSRQDGYGTMVVINRRRIAVVLDKQANRGAMVPVELIGPRIEDATRARIETWLETPATRLHAIQIPGSWFWPYKYETQSKVLDSSFIRTNMPNDPGF